MDDNAPAEDCLPAIHRTRDVLHRWLEAIDLEGWDGPAARTLLEFIRVDMIRPLVIDIGLRGLAAGQAESSAWQDVWAKLREPELRDDAQPWGVLWRIARRTALGEQMAAKYGSNARMAWRHERAALEGRPSSPLSLECLAEQGWIPSAPERGLDDVVALRVALQTTVAALMSVGWPQDRARELVAITALEHRRRDARSVAVGWRVFARDAEIPPWQARRLTVLLLGTPSSPGLVRRLLEEGADVLNEPGVRQALSDTRVYRIWSAPPPDPVATDRPQRRAS